MKVGVELNLSIKGLLTLYMMQLFNQECTGYIADSPIDYYNIGTPLLAPMPISGGPYCKVVWQRKIAWPRTHVKAPIVNTLNSMVPHLTGTNTSIFHSI